MVVSLPSTSPIRPVTSDRGFRVDCELWVCDRNNNPLRDITSSAISATVTVDWDQDIAWSLQAELDGNPFTSLREFLAPFFAVTWNDPILGPVTVRRQLGLYAVLPPDRTYDRASVTTHVTGQGMTSIMAQGTASRPMNFGPGTDLGDIAKTILANNVDTDIRYDVPLTGVMATRPRTMLYGDNLLAWANDALQSAGFSKLTDNHEGFISSSPLFRLVDVETPSRVISTAGGDVFGVVELKPDRERFYNRIYLKSNDSTADKQLLEGFVLENRDRDDPFSIPNLGYSRSLEITDVKDETADAMKLRAHKLLEAATSLQTRVELDVMPDPRVFPNEVWQLDIRQDDGTLVVPVGRYYAKTHTLDLTRGSQKTVLQFLARLSEVA